MNKPLTGVTRRKLRSSEWFNNPHNPGMTALYLERYLNYGLTRHELQSGKPIIGIAQTGNDLSPCNRHHLELAHRVREGIRAAGGTPIEFNTSAVSDGITMGTEGMRGSLVSREVIADSIELFVRSHLLDGVVETPVDEDGHVYHMFCVRSPERDRLAAALAEAEIGFAVYYQPPLHLQPALRYLGYSEGDFPETEKAARENLCLPLWAGIDEEQQAEVVSVIKRASQVVHS